MLRNYWVSIYAIVGWLFLSCLALAQSPSGQVVSSESPPIKEQNASQTANDHGAFPDFSVPVRIIENPDDAKHAGEREQKSDQHDSDDLDAQRRAADAAERSADAAVWQKTPTWVQIGFAAIGTLGLIWSLYLNTKATNTAIAGNRLALTAIKQEQTNAQKALRAYVGIEVVTILYGKTGRAKTKVTFKNTGQTPARDVMLVVHDHIMPIALAGNFPATDFSKAQSRMSLERDGYLEFEGETDDEMNDPKFGGILLQSLEAETYRIFVWGEVRYKDVFGEDWYTKFRFQNHKFGYNQNKNIAVVCADGNEAT